MYNETKLTDEFVLPRDLGAMAKTFFVQTEKPLRDGDWFIKKGSTVTGVKVIASGEKIREVQRLIRENLLPNGEKTKAQDWYKCENIGKVEFKEKRRGDDNVA